MDKILEEAESEVQSPGEPSIGSYDENEDFKLPESKGSNLSQRRGSLLKHSSSSEDEKKKVTGSFDISTPK
jgi:hypothetical protein